jgi:hypothetical protein
MLQRQAAESGRPANVLEKMVLGRLNKWVVAALVCWSFVSEQVLIQHSLVACTMQWLQHTVAESVPVLAQLGHLTAVAPLRLQISGARTLATTIWCRFYQDVCLLEQPYVMDDSQRVQDVIKVRSRLSRCQVARLCHLFLFIDAWSSAADRLFPERLLLMTQCCAQRLAEVQWALQLRSSHIGICAAASRGGPERGCAPSQRLTTYPHTL